MKRKLFLLSVLLAFNLALPLPAAQSLPVPDVSHLALSGGSRASVDLDFSIAGDIDLAVLSANLGRALTDRFQAAGYIV